MYGLACCLAAVLCVAHPDGDVLKRRMELTTAGRHEESELLLKDIPDTKVKDYQFYHFIRLANNFAMNKKKEAELHAKRIADAFSSTLPKRYQALVYMMTENLKTWEANDLSDIERDMRHSANRLGNAQGGKGTQQVQDDIVKKLDKLIKDQEDKAAAAAAAAQAKQDKESGKKPGQGEGQGQPAPDSIVMGGKGKGQVDEKQLRQIAENWGTLPPAQRAKIIQEITYDLPPKYKPMIDEYFKALNRIHK